MSIEYRIIRFKELQKIIGLSRSACYDKLNPKSKNYDKNAPKRYFLNGTPGRGPVGFQLADVLRWLKYLAEKSGVELNLDTDLDGDTV